MVFRINMTHLVYYCDMDSVYIIYNPNSTTGNAKDYAEQLKSELRDDDIPVELLETEYAGHAQELANAHAKNGVVIISSSGDGGVHEVVNGVLGSRHPEATIGVLPAGNANDYYTARHSGDIVDRINARDVVLHDVIKVSWNNHVRFAHSYAGVGISASTGKELTKHSLNPILEVWLILKHFFTRSSVPLQANGANDRYDSVVWSINNVMAKVLRFPDDNHRPDGMLSISTQRASSTIFLLGYFLQLIGTAPKRNITFAPDYTFTTQQETLLQLDGEVVTLPANTTVRVECVANALSTII